MTTTASRKTNGSGQGNGSAIRRAAERAGIRGALRIVPDPKASAGDEELLRAALEIIDAAQGTFETGDETTSGESEPASVLREALRTTAKEAAFLTMADASDQWVESREMFCHRLGQRAELALLIHDFRRKYGGNASANTAARNVLRNLEEGEAS